MSGRASCWVRRRRRREGAFTFLWLLAGALAPARDGFAQAGSGPLGQYTSAGGLRIEELESEESLEAAMEQSRWRFGGLRVAPYLGVRQAQYHNNVFAVSDDAPDQPSDVSVTLGAGFDAYLKTGSHVFYRLEVQPDYVYWLDLEERNQFNGHYSLSAHAFFNRLTFGVAARRSETEQIVTPEFAQPVTALREGAIATLGFDLGARFSLVFAGDITEIGNESASAGDPLVPDFSTTDREQTTASASLVWKLPNGIELGGGWQVAQAEFDPTSRALSVEGSGPLLTVVADGNKIHLRVELYQSSMTPEAGSIYPEQDVVGGRFESRFETGSPVELGFYGQRQLLFALDEGYADITHQRFGARLRSPLGSWTTLNLFVQTGDDEYSPIEVGVPARTDDEFSWGASLEVPLPRAFPEGLQVQLGYRQTELSSNLPGLDRDFGGPIFSIVYSIGDEFLWQ